MTKIRKSRAILSHLHELKERRYAGNLDAADELIDFETARSLAQLTKRQNEAVTLVFDYGLQQDHAAKVMGVTKQRVTNILNDAEKALDEIYEYWSRLDEEEAV